jgi:hypothetical protein
MEVIFTQQSDVKDIIYEYFAAFGKQGGTKVAEKYGREHMQAMQRASAEARRRNKVARTVADEKDIMKV